ncbi:NADH dehydrogenase (ubiquinone) B16.6 subunit [Lasioglossum baleicum]|uniref:NADH dehydrogenase (ubiquinone) B16.6 subunit n=1 Tax=Lasioglossum baleicum TaxID=434251 RepID=UPI003FCD959B
MATAAKSGPQDMPPKGGYSPYQIERVPLRTVIGGRTGVAIFLTCTFGGLYLYGQTYKRIKIEELEMRSARHALQPMMEAERDRAILKHMRRLRDEEADLMKKFPGWEVGKFFSEPIFQTLQDDTFVEPTFEELTVHSNPEEYKAHVLRIFFA